MSDNLIYTQQASEEQLIHSELVAIYLETTNNGYVDEEIWRRVNELLQQLSARNSRYQAYMLQSENIAKSIPVMRFKQQLRSAIQVLSVQEGIEDLSDIVRRNHLGSGTTFHNIATANPAQINSQDVNVNVEQRISLIVKEIENNLTDEQLEQLTPLLEEYKKKPTRNAAEKLIGGIFNLGKDIAIGIIANIISKQLGI